MTIAMMMIEKMVMKTTTLTKTMTKLMIIATTMKAKQLGRAKRRKDRVTILHHRTLTYVTSEFQGCLLGDVSYTRGSKVTTCTGDLLCRRLYTADNKGYVTVWKMEEFLEKMEDVDRVEQV